MENKMEPLTVITRSYSYKLNMGNYESRDFFMSQSLECPLSKAEETSDKLYTFCREQVIKAVKVEKR
jgi:hypothetical protein